MEFGIKLEFPATNAVDDCRFMQTNPNPKRHALTLQRLEIIRRNLDKADAEIARLLGVCRQAVHSLRQRYKITKVHASIQHKQRMTEQMRRLKPGLSGKAAAAQLGISEERTRMYGKLTGYQFIGVPAARHFHWQKRIKSLSPLLTVSAVARELGVTPGYAALLCHRHKYKVTIRNGWKPARVPIRRWLRRPYHERWLASLKPAKP
jgi:transposase-like protein